MKKLINISLLIVGVVSADTLPTIIVDDKKESSTNISSFKVNQKQIENTLKGNGDIGSVIKLNPNLVVEDKNKTIESITEITPSKIEINGAKYYQNLFLVDGLSIDSSLDPVNNNSYAIQDVPGNENEMFIDLDLIESIEVFDSNIPAKYGNFSGGVIDAKTKRADFKTHANIKIKKTDDAKVKFHTKEIKNLDDAENVTKLKDLKYEKTFLSTYFSSKINEKSAFWVNYNYKKATEPKRYFTNFKEIIKESHNFLAKYSYFFEDDSILDLSALYAPYTEKHFRTEVKDSDFTNKGGGVNLKANYEKNYNFWKLTADASLSRNENTRTGSAKDYKPWRKTNTKDWGLDYNSPDVYSKEGGYGNIEKTEDYFKSNINLESNNFLFKGIENKISTGLQFSYGKTKYLRKEDTYVYNNPSKHNSFLECNGASNDCVENEQFFKERQVYQKENVKVDIANLGLYVDDRLKYGRFEFTPGFRVDYNDFLKNIDLAHRLNTSVDVFKDGKTKIFAGINRYYDKSFLGFKLREARTPYKTEYRDNHQNQINSPFIPANQINITKWNASADKGDDKYIYNKLKTPYTDERVIGLKQEFKNNSILLKYLERVGKNHFKEKDGEEREFTKPNGEKEFYRPIFVTNSGRTKYNTFSISLSNIKPINLGFSELNYYFSTSIPTVQESNFNDYNLDESEDRNDYIEVNGKKIRSKDKPKDEVPQKYNLRVDINNIKAKILNIPVNMNISNTLIYQDSYTALFKENFNPAIDEYVKYNDKRYSPYWTFDTRLSIDYKLKKKHTLNTSFEIINLFDKTKEENLDKNYYDLGRQFWFELAYKF